MDAHIADIVSRFSNVIQLAHNLAIGMQLVRLEYRLPAALLIFVID